MSPFLASWASPGRHVEFGVLFRLLSTLSAKDGTDSGRFQVRTQPFIAIGRRESSRVGAENIRRHRSRWLDCHPVVFGIVKCVKFCAHSLDHNTRILNRQSWKCCLHLAEGDASIIAIARNPDSVKYASVI